MSNGSRALVCRPHDQSSLVTSFSIQGVYGLCSIVLYLLNIRALRSKRNNLDRTFSRLYIISAVLSIVYFLDHFCIRRFVKLGFWCEEIYDYFSEQTFLLNPYKTVASYCPIAILVLHFSISSHRMTIVMFPMRSHTVWNEFFCPIAISALLSPLIFMWFMVPCKSYAKLDPEGGLDIEYKKVFELSASMWSALAAVIFGSLTLTNTFLIVVMLSKIRIKSISSQEIRLIIFEILMCCTTLSYAVIQALLYYSIYIVKDDVIKSHVIQYRTFVIDVLILPHAWTLLVLSKTVRQSIMRLIVKRKGLLGSDSTRSRMLVSVMPITKSQPLS